MILVTGATGSIGRHLVTGLWKQGEVANGALAVTTSAVRDLTGRAPQTFDQFINANVAALDAAWGGHPHGR